MTNPKCKVCGEDRKHHDWNYDVYHPFTPDVRHTDASVSNGQPDEADTAVSEQAWESARKLSWPHLAGQDITWLAAALQKLMDERDVQRRRAEDWRAMHDKAKGRAE